MQTLTLEPSPPVLVRVMAAYTSSMRSVCFVFAILALASDRADADWTLAAYLGGASTARAGLSLQVPAEQTVLTFANVRYDGESFASPFYYGYRVGHTVGRPWLSLEGELVHLKVFARTNETVRVNGMRAGVPVDATERINDTIQRFSISHGVNLLLLNAVVRHPWRGPNLVLAVRAGAGPTIPHAESTIRGIDREEYELGRPAWQAAAGAEIGSRRLHAIVEYKLTRTRQRVAVNAGDAETVLLSQHLTAGLGVRF